MEPVTGSVLMHFGLLFELLFRGAGPRPGPEIRAGPPLGVTRWRGGESTETFLDAQFLCLVAAERRNLRPSDLGMLEKQRGSAYLNGILGACFPSLVSESETH